MAHFQITLNPCTTIATPGGNYIRLIAQRRELSARVQDETDG